MWHILINVSLARRIVGRAGWGRRATLARARGALAADDRALSPQPPGDERVHARLRHDSFVSRTRSKSTPLLFLLADGPFTEPDWMPPSGFQCTRIAVILNGLF